jgi:hypothetical protein
MLIKNFPIIFKFFVRKSKIVLKKGVLIIIFKMRDKYIITFCSQTLELYQHSGCNRFSRFSDTLKHRKKNKISVQILDIFSINCLTRIVKISQPLSLFSLSLGLVHEMKYCQSDTGCVIFKMLKPCNHFPRINFPRRKGETSSCPTLQRSFVDVILVAKFECANSEALS